MTRKLLQRLRLWPHVIIRIDDRQIHSLACWCRPPVDEQAIAYFEELERRSEGGSA